MLKFDKNHSTPDCLIWSCRKLPISSSQVKCVAHSLSNSGHEYPNKRLKAAREWRLFRLSKTTRVLVKSTKVDKQIVAIVLWRKDLDRVSDYLASHDNETWGTSYDA